MCQDARLAGRYKHLFIPRSSILGVFAVLLFRPTKANTGDRGCCHGSTGTKADTVKGIRLQLPRSVFHHCMHPGEEVHFVPNCETFRRGCRGGACPSRRETIRDRGAGGKAAAPFTGTLSRSLGRPIRHHAQPYPPAADGQARCGRGKPLPYKHN